MIGVSSRDALGVGGVAALAVAVGCAPLGSAFEIQIGDLALETHEVIDLGSVPYGYSQEASLRIGNVGTGVLVGTAAFTSTSSPGSFSVSPNSFVLDVEERLELAISFHADDFGEAEDVLNLKHDGVGSAIALEVIAVGDEDSDGDGYTHEDSGGDDCNDRNAYVHPGAEEIWYDGIDQDCDDASDFDADLDGYDRSIYGGTDCDDTDASVFPGAKDVPEDGVDQDCDGED